MKKGIIIFGAVLAVLLAGFIFWNASFVQAFGSGGTCNCSIDPETGQEICCSCSSDGSACSGQGTACGGGGIYYSISLSELKTIYG
ncbi:hypothetical protein HOG16_02660 [Candidatus Woesearchaeota archaeon]|jgi:hypothetical protein|nr:hypothetical protein [Candidatus Woesearchaeota archaeon]MBT4321999.1 hypothetical protein [Candidatus Woesearchaeota archaeon]MBT4630745.1 hypothetical protein [Candidatus Woesearchaeota archaeon]